MTPIQYSALFVAVCAVAACAQPGVAPQPSSDEVRLEQRFQRLDANGDGFVIWKEAAPLRARDFRHMDSNKDRAITQAEYTAALPFAVFDQNADGAISREEFLATHHRMFMRFDADADQRISFLEFATAQRAAGR